MLEGDFDPKNFMDQIDGVDKSGNPVPDWKKQMLARNLAEKAFKEYEEKRKVRNNQLKNFVINGKTCSTGIYTAEAEICDLKWFYEDLLSAF